MSGPLNGGAAFFGFSGAILGQIVTFHPHPTPAMLTVRNLVPGRAQLLLGVTGGVVGYVLGGVLHGFSPKQPKQVQAKAH